MSKHKTKNNGIKKIVIVAIFMALVILTLHLGYNYLRDDIKDKTNLIVNNNNVTESLKMNVNIENGIIYLSRDDIASLLDCKIYYDKKYNQLVTTSYDKIAALPIGKTKIQVNSANTIIRAGVIEKDGTYYIPVSELEDVYNIKVEYNEETDIVIIDTLNKDYQIATASKNANVKYTPSSFSRTVDKVKKGETYVIANDSNYQVPNGWTKVRTQKGILGYVKTNKMGQINTIREGMEEKERESASNVYNYNLKEDVLKDYKKREKAINKIINYIAEHRLDGVNIKYENIEEEKLSYFLIELKPRLNEIGAALIHNKD